MLFSESRRRQRSILVRYESILKPKNSRNATGSTKRESVLSRKRKNSLNKNNGRESASCRTTHNNFNSSFRKFGLYILLYSFTIIFIVLLFLISSTNIEGILCVASHSKYNRLISSQLSTSHEVWQILWNRYYSVL